MRNTIKKHSCKSWFRVVKLFATYLVPNKLECLIELWTMYHYRENCKNCNCADPRLTTGGCLDLLLPVQAWIPYCYPWSGSLPVSPFLSQVCRNYLNLHTRKFENSTILRFILYAATLLWLFTSPLALYCKSHAKLSVWTPTFLNMTFHFQ